MIATRFRAMMRLAIPRPAVVLLFVLAACASGGRAAGTSPSPTTPPRMINSDHPTLATPTRTSEAEFRLDWSVMVDTDGRADMSTLRLTGNALSDNRIAITEWLARSRFEPATVDGVPVRAGFKGGVRTRTVRRPM